MKKFVKIAGLAIVLMGLLFVGYVFTANFFDNHNPLMKPHMWAVTRAWTGVPDLPDDATDFQIKTYGDSLTRKFESSFKASTSSIEAWLSQIPDFDRSAGSELRQGAVEYRGRGREGATYYRLTLNHSLTEVQLYVSWN
jgi:hypothetical protein